MQCKRYTIVILIVFLSFLFANILVNVQPVHASSIVLIDSYSQTNADSSYGLETAHPSGNLYYSAVAQSFSVSQTASISSVTFYLSRTGSPSGNLRAELYAMSGAYGVNSAPTGTLLAYSGVMAANNVTTDLAHPQLYSFTFATPYLVSLGSHYCIAIVAYGSFDTSNYVYVMEDSISPTHPGNAAAYNYAGWIQKPSTDLIFYVYGSNYWNNVESWTVGIPNAAVWHNTETWIIKSFGSNYVNVTISITGSGTTSPAAGFYNVTYRRGDTLTITAFPGVGYTYYGMVRNGILWTTSNPGQFLNLGNVGFTNENIQVIFLQWHTVESWTVLDNVAASWHTVESWTVNLRSTRTWRIVESWTVKSFTTSGFHVAETWTIKLFSQHTLVWHSVETWTVMSNSTSYWHTVETWNVSETTTVLAFHDIETWTLNAYAAKQIISWNPALQFYLSAYDTYVGFDDTVYFDNFTLASTYVTLMNVYMDHGAPVPSLTISMQGGNVSFGQIDYGNAISFMFYASKGATVRLSLTGLDSTPYTVTIDGVPSPVDTGWSWDGTTLTVSYIMPSSTSHVVLSWAVISTYWHDVEPWTVSLNPPGAIVSGITWYYRSNTITANSITGYELSPDMDSLLSHVSQNLGVTTDVVEFGFTVNLVNSHNVTVSLTGDLPTAIITRATVGEGYESATFDVSDSALVLGMDTLDVKLYIRLSLSTWLLSEEYTSRQIMYSRLVASTWQFNLYTKTELDTSNNVIATVFWGDNTHVSGISGMRFQTPTPQEWSLYYAGRGDWIHAVLYPYMIYAGDTVYGLGFLFVGGVMYLRHKKWEVILACLLLFGGSSGVGLLIPQAAYRLLYVVVALAFTWLLTRVFK